MGFHPAQLALSRRSRGVCWLVMLAALAVSALALFVDLPAWLTSPVYFVGMVAALLLVSYSRRHPQSVEELVIQWRTSSTPVPRDVVDPTPGEDR
ncbi:hypothetical protein GCM10028801_44580 [Nocardioides maradonensis]